MAAHVEKKEGSRERWLPPITSARAVEIERRLRLPVAAAKHNTATCIFVKMTCRWLTIQSFISVSGQQSFES